MTVRELETRMGSDELAGWLAFEQEYGVPDGYFVAAAVCRTVAAAFTGDPGEPGDYVPYFRRPPREQTAAEQQAMVRARLAGARVRAAAGGV